MLLHRLFENRAQIDESNIEDLIGVHISEFFRLLNVPLPDRERRKHECLEAWPFAPNLLRLLEEQVLVATDAQETRDLIRILANLFKSSGEKSPVLTAADFRIDKEDSGIGSLLDSVANQRHRAIREKARHNIASVEDALQDHERRVPHLREIVSALWLRSIAVENYAGAEPATLQTDITRSAAIDDNAFQAELAVIVENSFNIHRDGPKLIFREDENPQAKLLAYARNAKLFENGRDLDRLAKEIRYVVGGTEDYAREYKVVVLPKSWRIDPWSGMDESERPENWDDRFPILVLPEEPENLEAILGQWIKDHLTKKRNTVRFLLPGKNAKNVFADDELILLARAEQMADEWKNTGGAEYRELFTKYQKELRERLKRRFDRFAILRRWDYQNPDRSQFCVERIPNGGTQPVEGIKRIIKDDLFVTEDFEALVAEAAHNGGSVGKLLNELKEPRPAEFDCIPWLGEVAVKEMILKMCARGRIAVNVRGQRYLQQKPGEDYDAAWARMKSELSFGGYQLNEVILLEPSSVPSTGGAVPITVQTTNDYNGGVAPVPIITPPPIVSPPTNGGSQPSVVLSVPRNRVSLSNPSTSPLNLIGKLEEWNIGPASKVGEVSIKITEANGAQLKELLKKLPDGMTFAISLEKEEDK
jgi:hypothetical protein